MSVRSDRLCPVAIQPDHVYRRVARDFFGDPPLGHFWLEHLVRALARPSKEKDSSWQLFTLTSPRSNLRKPEVSALYAIQTASRYAMFHATDYDVGAALLTAVLEHHPPEKVLGNYAVMEATMQTGNLQRKIVRDHREIFLTLSPGDHKILPDWQYRMAHPGDIARLREYNRLYNIERNTHWSRDWEQAIAHRTVYVRELDREISSCLLRGAILPPRASLGGTFTFPEFRGLGEASLLIANYCAEMTLYNLEVCLIVDDDNLAALRTYSKVGFSPSGLYRTTYFGDRP